MLSDGALLLVLLTMWSSCLCYENPRWSHAELLEPPCPIVSGSLKRHVGSVYPSGTCIVASIQTVWATILSLFYPTSQSGDEVRFMSQVSYPNVADRIVSYAGNPVKFSAPSVDGLSSRTGDGLSPLTCLVQQTQIGLLRHIPGAESRGHYHSGTRSRPKQAKNVITWLCLSRSVTQRRR